MKESIGIHNFSKGVRKLHLIPINNFKTYMFVKSLGNPNKKMSKIFVQFE